MLSRPAHAAELDKLSPDLRQLVQNVRAGKPAQFLSGGRNKVAAPQVVATTKLHILVRTAGNNSSAHGGYDTARVTNRLRSKVSRLRQSFSRVGIADILATPDQIAALTADPSVASISLDRPVKLASTSPELDVNGRAVGADVAGQAIAGGAAGIAPNGTGVGVAILDSGVAPVADLAGHIAGFKDFVNNATTPYDDNGHGTHVAGIVAGSGASSSGANAKRTYKGIAPGAQIIGVKVLAADGSGSASQVIAALDWCIANRAAYNIRVINLSLAGAVTESTKTDPLCQAAERAVDAGIVVVAAAGNRGGYGKIGAPGNDPAVITVGAVDTHQTTRRSDDYVASFSGRGPTRFDLNIKPDVVAPGKRVVSLRAPGSRLDTLYGSMRVPTSEYLKGSGSSGEETAYYCMSGTSMAAPAVAATAALMLQVNPALPPAALKLALMDSAQLLQGTDPLTGRVGYFDPFTQGAGEVNVPGAVTLASLMTPSGLSASPTPVSYIAGNAVPWSAPLLAGNILSWRLANGTITQGTGVIWEQGLIWDDSPDEDTEENPPPPPPPGQVEGEGLIWDDSPDEFQTSDFWGAETTSDNSMVWQEGLIWDDSPDEDVAEEAAQEEPTGEVWGEGLIWDDSPDEDVAEIVTAEGLIWDDSPDEDEYEPVEDFETGDHDNNSGSNGNGNGENGG